MSSEVILLVEGIGAALCGWVRQATRQLTLVAPFIKRKALERLLVDADPRVPLTVYTRWDVAEVAAGVSDLSVLDLIAGRGSSQLFLHPRLHAKLLLVDDSVAAFGSANVTDAALGFEGQPNLEITAVVQPVPNRIYQFLLRLEREATTATEELRRQIDIAAQNMPQTSTPPEMVLGNENKRIMTAPFPRFRDPERLYRAYLSILGFNDRDTRNAILDDLDVLALPEGLDESTFRSQVGTRLLAIRTVAAFDDYVAQPRFFGDMADWLKASGVLADQEPETRKLYLQTLVRWLRHFLPGRYRLEQPNYSELFGRTEGWER